MQQKKRMHVGLWKTDTYIHIHTWDGTILRSIVACASLICTKYCFFFYRLTYFLRSRMNLTFQKLSKYILLGRAAEIISWMTYESGENSKVNSNQRTNDQSHGYSASSASFPPHASKHHGMDIENLTFHHRHCYCIIQYSKHFALSLPGRLVSLCLSQASSILSQDSSTIYYYLLRIRRGILFLDYFHQEQARTDEVTNLKV